MRSRYEIFLQIVDSGSITKACAELNISQPALSKQLRRLEDELKVQLFERSPNGVRLTPYGEALVAPARAMRDAGQSARAVVERLRLKFSGHVAFGVSGPIGFHILPQVALDLQMAAPGLDLSVIDDRPDILLGLVRRSEIEFAVCSSYLGFSDEFVTYDIMDDIGFIIASRNHEIFKQDRMDPRCLVEHGWVGALQARETRLDQKAQNLGITLPRMKVETLSVVHTVKLIESGRFISLLPTITVRKQLGDGSFAPILPELFSTTFQFKAVMRRDAQLSSGAKIIIDAFRTIGRTM